MRDGTFLIETTGRSYGHFFQATRVLYDSHSKLQRICVFDTADVGRVLMLDNAFNASEMMEPFYHEPMAHVPLAMRREAATVLVIGGGDFALAKQVLKHPGVDRLVICEYDAEVLHVCRLFFPAWSACERDPRVEVIVADGFEYLANQAEGAYDVILVDSTDLFSSAAILGSEEFYARASRSLAPGGVMMQIVADALFYGDVWPTVLTRARQHFERLAPIFVPVPFYVTGSWGLLLAGRAPAELDPARISEEYLARIPDLQTMTPELARGWFSLPPFLRQRWKDFWD